MTFEIFFILLSPLFAVVAFEIRAVAFDVVEHVFVLS